MRETWLELALARAAVGSRGAGGLPGPEGLPRVVLQLAG